MNKPDTGRSRLDSLLGKLPEPPPGDFVRGVLLRTERIRQRRQRILASVWSIALVLALFVLPWDMLQSLLSGAMPVLSGIGVELSAQLQRYDIVAVLVATILMSAVFIVDAWRA